MQKQNQIITKQNKPHKTHHFVHFSKTATDSPFQRVRNGILKRVFNTQLTIKMVDTWLSEVVSDANLQTTKIITLFCETSSDRNFEK